MEHVVSYPDRYSPAFACSAILYPLPIRTFYNAFTDRPIRAEVNGLTEFHDDDTVGWVLPFYRRSCVSVFRWSNGTSDRMPFWPRRM